MDDTEARRIHRSLLDDCCKEKRVDAPEERVVDIFPELSITVSSPPETRDVRYRAIFRGMARIHVPPDRRRFGMMEEMLYKMARHHGFDIVYGRELRFIRQNMICLFGITEDDICDISGGYVRCSIVAHAWAIANSTDRDNPTVESFRICNSHVGITFDCIIAILAFVDRTSPLLPPAMARYVRLYTDSQSRPENEPV